MRVFLTEQRGAKNRAGLWVNRPARLIELGCRTYSGYCFPITVLLTRMLSRITMPLPASGPSLTTS